MPVVLKPEHFAAWLDPKTQGQKVQDALSDALTEFLSYPVSTKVTIPATTFRSCWSLWRQSDSQIDQYFLTIPVTTPQISRS